MKQGENARTQADLLKLVEQILRESGTALHFDVADWLTAWLATPNPALNGAPPKSYLSTAEGRALVAGLLQKMQSGTFT